MRTILGAILILCICVTGCKDDLPPTDESCVHMPESSGVFGYQYHYMDSLKVSNAIFNPNNADELLYVEFADITSQSLVVFNRSTKQKTVLHTGSFLSNRQWGTNGWIIFNTMLDNTTGGYAIYKVRPDGSEKEILVPQNAFDPVLCPDGSKFLYVEGTSTFVVKDLEGNTLSNCPIGMGLLDPKAWFNDSMVVFGSVNQAWVHNVNHCSKSLVITSPYSEDGFKCLGLLPPDKIVWMHVNNGIYQTSITTGETTTIKSSCNGITYLSMDYSPQIDRMVLYREKSKTPDTVNVEVRTDLVLMKPDGLCEKAVEIR